MLTATKLTLGGVPMTPVQGALGASVITPSIEPPDVKLELRKRVNRKPPKDIGSRPRT